MLRTLTFIAVRQKHDQTAGTAPFRLTGRDELVDNNLCTVGEVTELAFPNDEFIRIGRGITVIKSEDSFFRQDGIVALEASLLFLQVLQRMIGTHIPARTILIVEGCMTVEEGAATNVFTRNANAIARNQQRRIGQILGHTPVDRQLAVAHGSAVLDDFLDAGVQGEAFGNGRQTLGKTLQFLEGNRRVTGFDVLLGQERRPVNGVRMLVTSQNRVVQQLALVQMLAIFLDHLVRTISRQRTFCNQLVAVNLAGARMLADDLVHQRLGDHRLVLLVVAKLAEADDVDHYILGVLLTVLDGNLGNQRHGFRVVAINVEDRGIDHLEDVGTVVTRTIVARIGGGEANLVVDHDMQRAARAVTARLGKVEHFLVHALTGHSGVAMDQDRHDLRLAAFTTTDLAGIDRAFDDRVDDLEVRRVERQGQVARASRGGYVGREPHVVLDIASGQIALLLALEFGEEHGRSLAQRVDQDVQATTVGHADDNLINAIGTTGTDRFVHGDDQRFATFQREALLANVLGVQVAFKGFRSSQTL